MAYLVPGVESVISFTPHLEKAVARLAAGEATPAGMRVAIGRNGGILDAVVRVADFREEKIPATAFQPPADYRDITDSPI
jgi:hypothetical protein